jgi:hypothetical protein
MDLTGLEHLNASSLQLSNPSFQVPEGLKIFEPTLSNPYEIDTSVSIIFRIACTAGVNRSATLREYLKTKVPLGIFYPQYGANYGDYDNPEIACVRTLESDGFKKLFGHDKFPSLQVIIFDALNYPISDHMALQKLNNSDREKYRNIIMKYYWNIGDQAKNVFIIINELDETINIVKNKLLEINKPIDLVILRIPDIIHEPSDNIQPYSKEAYENFVNGTSLLFKFV